MFSYVYGSNEACFSCSWPWCWGASISLCNPFFWTWPQVYSRAPQWRKWFSGGVLYVFNLKISDYIWENLKVFLRFLFSMLADGWPECFQIVTWLVWYWGSSHTAGSQTSRDSSNACMSVRPWQFILNAVQPYGISSSWSMSWGWWGLSLCIKVNGGKTSCGQKHMLHLCECQQHFCAAQSSMQAVMLQQLVWACGISNSHKPSSWGLKQVTENQVTCFANQAVIHGWWWVTTSSSEYEGNKGTHIFLSHNWSDQVYRYAGGSTRLMEGHLCSTPVNSHSSRDWESNRETHMWVEKK